MAKRHGKDRNKGSGDFLLSLGPVKLGRTRVERAKEGKPGHLRKGPRKTALRGSYTDEYTKKGRKLRTNISAELRFF